MKGASSLLTYILIFVISITALTIFTLMVISYYRNTSRALIEANFKQLAVYTSAEIVKMYNENSKSTTIPEKNTVIVLSNITLNYPQKVGGSTYQIEFISNTGIWNFVNFSSESKLVKEEISSNKIYLKTLQEPFVEYYFSIPNIPVELQGSFKSGKLPLLRYIRYNYNGTTYDRMILGEDEIIVGLLSIS